MSHAAKCFLPDFIENLEEVTFKCTGKQTICGLRNMPYKISFRAGKKKHLYINVKKENLTIREEDDEKQSQDPSQHSQDTNNEDGSVKVPVKVKEELTEAPAARKRSAAPWEESSSCASSTMSVASQTSLSRKKTRHLKWLKGKRVPTNQPDLFKRASSPQSDGVSPQHHEEDSDLFSIRTKDTSPPNEKTKDTRPITTPPKEISVSSPGAPPTTEQEDV